MLAFAEVSQRFAFTGVEPFCIEGVELVTERLNIRQGDVEHMDPLLRDVRLDVDITLLAICFVIANFADDGAGKIYVTKADQF